jgi:hypothetical protein
MKKRGMSDKERERKPEPPKFRFRETQVRPKNWLVPVILLTLRECSWNG